MPEETSKLGIKKPLGNETVSRAAFNENWDIIDLMAAREQFTIKSLSYDSANDRIEIVFGPGIAELFNNDAQTFVKKDTDTTYYINNPSTDTTYHVYIQADGTFGHNTSGIIPANAVLLWNITTGAELTTLTALDRRAVLSAAGARLVTHLAETAQKHITESGSNANGEYIRFDDGTQICWTILELPYFNSDRVETSWTLPAAMSTSDYVVNITLLRGNSNITPSSMELAITQCWQTDIVSVSSVGLFRVLGGTDFQPGDYAKVCCVAIGRWK